MATTVVAADNSDLENYFIILFFRLRREGEPSFCARSVRPNIKIPDGMLALGIKLK